MKLYVPYKKSYTCHSHRKGPRWIVIYDSANFFKLNHKSDTELRAPRGRFSSKTIDKLKAFGVLYQNIKIIFFTKYNFFTFKNLD
jgi:hypothetical protein